jgi:hypothetical protein
MPRARNARGRFRSTRRHRNARGRFAKAAAATRKHRAVSRKNRKSRRSRRQ